MPDDKESRRIAQRQVVEALSQHSSYLHRASTATVNKIIKVIDESGGSLLRELHDRLDNLTPAEMQAFASGRYTTSRLKGLRKLIDEWAGSLGERIDEIFTADAKDLAAHEAEFAHSMMTNALAETPAAAITGATAYSAAMSQPVLGEMVADMLADIPERTRKQVYSTIRQGIAQGETNQQIVRALRGTKALNYRDGLLQTTRNAAERVTRTARGHISNTAYLETYKALGVEEVVWVASLELRTCKRCAPLDGERYKVNEPHPRPVLHPSCRCSLAPSFGGEIMGKRPYVRALKVTGRDGNSKFRSIGNMTKKQREDAGLKVGQASAKMTFADWFGRQPARYQAEWLGDTKYRLYRDGGYTLDRFTDPRNKEYSVADLRQKDAETFAELFG